MQVREEPGINNRLKTDCLIVSEQKTACSTQEGK